MKILNKLTYIILLSCSLVKGQNLGEYQQQALQNNPELQSLQKNIEIAKERVNEANALPDTEFGLGYFMSEPETRTGPQKFKISVKQMIPWFGTVKSREDYAGSLVSLEEIDLEIARKKLNLNISQLYYDLFELKEKQEILQDNIDLLEVYRTMALNSIETGKASAVEVLRLKMRQNDLEEQQKNLQLQVEAMETEFNNLLNSEENIPVIVEDTLILPAEQTENTNLALHPELQRFEEFAKSVESSEIMNQQEALPSLGFGMDYVNVQERKDLQIPDTGKDILMPMLSFSIPIFSKKYKSVSLQNDLKQQQIISDRQSKMNDLGSRLKTALNERASARIKFETQLDNLSQAKEAEELLLKQYETGTIDFDDVLDLQEIELNVQLNLIEAVSTYFKKDAIVKYLTVNKY